MTLPQMLEDLPKSCDIGMKKNAKGLVEKWIGYKLHIDTADGGIPISCVLTSASTHDSQVAIPLGTLTAGRVENLYDLMDSAYDSIEIWAHSISLGHKPIIDVNPRGSVDMKEALKLEKRARRTLGLVFPEEVATPCARRPSGSMGGSRMSSAVVMCAFAATRRCSLTSCLASALAVSQLMRFMVPPI